MVPPENEKVWFWGESFWAAHIDPGLWGPTQLIISYMGDGWVSPYNPVDLCAAKDFWRGVGLTQPNG